MYMSVCCTPGRIRRFPLPTLLCYFKRCCFNHTFDKKRYSKIILVVDFKSRWRRCFVWRCVVDDINRCTCRCVVHPVGSEDSARFLFTWHGLRPADGVFCAVRVPSVETTVLLFDLPMSVKNLFVRFCRFSSLIVDQ